MTALRQCAFVAGLAFFATASINASESQSDSNEAASSEAGEADYRAITTIAVESESDYVPVPDRAIVITGGANGVHREVVRVLYDTSDMHFQDASVPRFLMIDRQGNTLFGIGGYVEGVMQ